MFPLIINNNLFHIPAREIARDILHNKTQFDEIFLYRMPISEYK